MRIFDQMEERETRNYGPLEIWRGISSGWIILHLYWWDIVWEYWN